MGFIVEIFVSIIFEGLILKFFKALGYGFHWLILTLSFYSKEEKYTIIKEDQSYHGWIGFIVLIMVIGLKSYYYLKKNKKKRLNY